MKKKLKTVIIDDHKIFGEGFCSLLESNNFRVMRVFQNSKKALNYLKKSNGIESYRKNKIGTKSRVNNY